MSNRIYGTRTDINEQEVRDFYNSRKYAIFTTSEPRSPRQ